MSEIQTNLWQEWADAAAHAGPRHARLASAIRTAIRQGQLRDGAVLPPSRELAEDLGSSRWVVTQAYEQLIAEGYLEARTGAGTRVRLASGPGTIPPERTEVPTAARFDLMPGLPDLRAFPRTAWSRVWRGVLASTPNAELAYPPPGGHPRLREVLADYLGRVRGAIVSPDHVTITTGVREGMACLASLLSAHHHQIAVEDPGWTRLRRTLESGGLTAVPIPVDPAGARTDQLPDTLRLAQLTPAHHFPTGTVLAPDRRAAALAWAERVDGLLLEDDYDAEFRYDRRPVGSLQGLNPERVALFGSVSKTLAPALRLGWVVTPAAWTDALRAASPDVPVLDQLALARLIDTGGYDRHLRRLRRSYRDRRDRLVAALAAELPDCRVSGVAAGLHLLVQLPPGVRADGVVRAAAARGVQVMDLATCRVRPDAASAGLVLGYGNLDDRLLDDAVRELTQAVRTAAAG